MGGAASVTQDKNAANEPNVEEAITCSLRSIREAMEEALFVREKWPLVVDPSGQAARFLAYQPGPYLLALSPDDMAKDNLRTALVGALGHGSMMTICFDTLDISIEELFEEGKFPMAILDRSQVFKEEFWGPLLTPEEKEDFEPKSEFCFCVCTKAGVTPEMAKTMAIINCLDSVSKNNEEEEDAMAEVFGAKEVKKNSAEMVEAAFDGEFDVVQKKIEEGCDVESVDGSKHTALSEAASQGHDEIVKYLLDLGANPNNVNVKNRSPVWRAAYNGHHNTVKILLEAGCDPRLKDSTSMEGPFDVAKTDEVRAMIQEWNVEKTDELIIQWQENRRKKIEANIKTAAEREAYEKSRLREEFIQLVNNGDTEALKTRLQELAQDAESKNTRPIGTADTIRDSRGMTLLALATEKDNVEMVTMLLTQWKTIKAELEEIGLSSSDANDVKVFKTNANAKDSKGWNLAAVAVFHNAKKSLDVLLRHGADPHEKSSYHKSAWDIAQDELDAARNVVKSNAEIRSVIEDWEKETAFLKDGQSVKQASAEAENPLAEGPKEGTAVMLAVEVAKESQPPPKKTTGKGKKGGKVKKKKKKA